MQSGGETVLRSVTGFGRSLNVPAGPLALEAFPAMEPDVALQEARILDLVARAYQTFPHFFEQEFLSPFAPRGKVVALVERVLRKPRLLPSPPSPPKTPNHAAKGRPLAGLTPRHQRVVELRLQGKDYRQIAKEVGEIRHSAAQGLLQRALRFLDEPTRRQLTERRMGPRPDQKKRERVVKIFFRELERGPTPHGVLRRAARYARMNYFTYSSLLRRVGVHVRGEIQRRRLDFALKVAATMEQPFEKTRKDLGVSHGTLAHFRRLVRGGRHVRGAIELVKHPKAEQWWELDSSFFSGRVNLSVRNRSVSGDLQLFDDSIAEARRLMGRWHPDKPANQQNPIAPQHFRAASERYSELLESRGRYVVKEIAFRRRFGLPMHMALQTGP